MININGVSFHKRSGELDWLGMALEDISRPGYDGAFYREIGLRADKAVIQVMLDFNSRTLANIAFSQFKAWEGQQVVVIDSYGIEPITYPVVIVHKVRKMSESNTGAIAGYIRNSTVSYNATILELEFTLQVNG